MSYGDDTQTIWLPNEVMRERAKVDSTTVDALNNVRGYLVPRYVDELTDGRRVAELYSKDLARVQDGYACGECLAYFDRRFATCPSCGHALDVNRDVVEFRPRYWEPTEGRTSGEILGR